MGYPIWAPAVDRADPHGGGLDPRSRCSDMVSMSRGVDSIHGLPVASGAAGVPV